MATPTFSPPVGPSFDYQEEWIQESDVVQFHAGYDQTIPQNIHARRRASLRWNALKEDHIHYLEGFVQNLNGSRGKFWWTPPDKVPTPSIGATLTQVAGGALGATTYYVTYTWYDSTYGETKESPEVSLAVSSSFFLRVTVPAIPNGVEGWRAYVSTSTGTEKLEATTTTGSRTWTQSAALSGVTDPPSANNLKPQVGWVLAGNLTKTRISSATWTASMTLEEQLI